MITIFTDTFATQFNPQVSCTRKRRYTGTVKAKAAAKDMTKRHKKKFCVYLCKFCGDYHVGTDTSKSYKKRLKRRR